MLNKSCDGLCMSVAYVDSDSYLRVTLLICTTATPFTTSFITQVRSHNIPIISEVSFSNSGLVVNLVNFDVFRWPKSLDSASTPQRYLHHLGDVEAEAALFQEAEAASAHARSKGLSQGTRDYGNR